MNQNNSPDTAPFSFAKSFLDHLRQYLENANITEAEFVCNADLSPSQWEHWLEDELRPMLDTLDEILLANRLSLRLEVEALSPFAGSLRDFLLLADKLNLHEVTDSSGNTFFEDEAGKRVAVVLEADALMIVLVDCKINQCIHIDKGNAITE